MVLNWGHYCPLRDVWKLLEAFSEGGRRGRGKAVDIPTQHITLLPQRQTVLSLRNSGPHKS